MTRGVAAVVAAALVSISPTVAQPLAVKAKGTRTITLTDKVGKNQLAWVSDAPLEKIDGTAEGITGRIVLDPSKPTSIRGTISAQVATMKTGNGMRDEHLRGDKWLDAANYPTISFTAKSVSGAKVEGNKVTAQVVGDFTMHGVTRQMTVPFTLTYIDGSPKTRERAPGDLVMITAEFDVSLKDFNVAGSAGIVGNKVGESIHITAQLFGSTGL